MLASLETLLSQVFSDKAVVFILSLLPVSEIRGGIIFASIKNVEMISAFIISFIGNMIPIPFILLFIKKLFSWMKKTKRLGKIVDKMTAKAEKGAKKLGKYEIFGLFLLVAIPLPGTGAWTGALVASFVNMRIKHSLPAIAAGVLAAGLIMVTLFYGAPDLFKTLFG